MSSRRKGDLSAVAKAEILSPEITIFTRGQVFHFTETSNGLCDNNGEHGYGVSGSKFAAGKLTVVSELGRSVQLPNGYWIEAEKVTKKNGCTEVGLVHSSMPMRHVEGTNTRTLRRRQNYAER